MRYKAEDKGGKYRHFHFEDRITPVGDLPGVHLTHSTLNNVSGVAEVEVRENGYLLVVKRAELSSWESVTKNLMEFLSDRLHTIFEDVDGVKLSSTLDPLAISAALEKAHLYLNDGQVLRADEEIVHLISQLKK